MKYDSITQLIELYKKQSKHSNYQLLSSRLQAIVRTGNVSFINRYERERLAFIKRNATLQNKTVLDIGGNTGFFSLESIEAGARMVYYYEGNAAHARFVKLAAHILDVENSIRITNDYFQFRNGTEKHYDICLLLNVLHHFGDDYGDKSVSIEKAKESILTQLNSMARVTSLLIFQLGFNWKGNRKTCLFENGTKSEMINFIKNGTTPFWDILEIGIAEKENDVVSYNSPNDKNIIRDDNLGEFLNRPIFILKSNKCRH